MKVVSLYVDQKPEGDLSGDRARGVRLPGLSDHRRGPALRRQANWRWMRVLIIGEHGNYPRNEKGQILYPRYEFFEQCAKVFEQDGRAVPVYNDKHLSYSFEKAKAMVDDVAAAELPDARRVVAAGDLAAAGDRPAARAARSRRR